jgi:hypothetical protein
MENDVPVHQGLEIEVSFHAEDIDAAIARAVAAAESALIFLAAASRAPIAAIRPIVAYDITPGITQHPLVQWVTGVMLGIAKQVVPQDVFGAIFDGVSAQPERLAQRLMLSMSWHRQALDEKDPGFRFLKLWLACEALEPVLADHYHVDGKGFQGLRQLAIEGGFTSEDISHARKVRRDLYHALRVKPDHIRTGAVAALPMLESLVIEAWFRLLGKPEIIGTLPSTTITPHYVMFQWRGAAVCDDPSKWGKGIHPYFDVAITLRRLPARRPGSITITYDVTGTPKNMERGMVTGYGLMGPSGLTSLEHGAGEDTID